MREVSHLELLREEHLELQNKFAELNRRYELLVATSNTTPSSEKDASFVYQLLETIKRVHEKDQFSDVTVKVEGHSVPCHRIVLASRTDFWADLQNLTELVLDDIRFSHFVIVKRWMYTDILPVTTDDESLLSVCQIAVRLRIKSLQQRCVDLLIARLDVSNCVRVYEFAEKEDIAQLRDKCAAVVSARWSEFGPSHFAQLSAPLLYRMLKGRSNNVLHSIIELNREDVLFLYFIEHGSQLERVVNECNINGMTALEKALSVGNLSIAKQLIEHKANVNTVDINGLSLLMKMIQADNSIGCEFAVSNGADVRQKDEQTGRGPLHFLAESSTQQLPSWLNPVLSKMEMDLQDVDGRTALMLAVDKGLIWLIELLLDNGADVNMIDNKKTTALRTALFEKSNLEVSEKLVKKGANVNQSCENGATLLHLAVAEGNHKICKFLVDHSCDTSRLDSDRSTALHLAIRKASPSIVATLLSKNLNVMDILDADGDSPLHIALATAPQLLETMVKHTKNINWDLRDSAGKTALEIALQEKQLGVAKLFIQAGCPVNLKDQFGCSMLVHSLLDGDDEAVVFLLSQGADHSMKDQLNRSCLELAAYKGFRGAITALCGAGVSLNQRTDSGNGYTVLERALVEGHWDCASLLISLGCDCESWTETEDCHQTLLHHLMDKGLEEAAVFLISHGCDVNVPRRFPPDSGDEGHGPVHLAVSYNLIQVLAALVKAGADLNVQDTAGRTACHLAVRERNLEAVNILLSASDVSFISTRDKLGQTPLSQAIYIRDHKIADAIVTRQPHAALQSNGNGENLLHLAVKANDLESVLFLLGTNMDPARPTTDATRRTALHMAVAVPDEMIMRNLILAGCEVNARSTDGSTPLQESVRANRADLAAILLENGANPNIMDDRAENSLSAAVRSGSVDCVRLLLSSRSLERRAVNKSGQSALHVCSQLPPDRIQKGSSAAEMCELLLLAETPQPGIGAEKGEKELAAYVDSTDLSGNSALLLAYMAGNAGVCRSLLRRAATMGARNSDGITMFNYETPTKQLLFGLLESLEREPRWSDGDACECGTRFSITQRKHHCRHCGRLACGKCSDTTMAIAKFGEDKRVRVCSLCANVIMGGVR